jgi:hypothetical protein
MGREIVYCEGCGKKLTENDFLRGKAQEHDKRPFCASCRPVTAPPPRSSSSKATEIRPAPATRAEGRSTERRSATGVARRRGATERIPLAQAPVGRLRKDLGGSRVALYVGGGLAALVLAVVAVANNSRESASPPPTEVAAPASKPSAAEPRPSALEVAELRLRELEAFATPTADPKAVLARAEPLRAAVRGTPLEARFKRIEAAAQERMKDNERSFELDRALASIRKIIAEDPVYARRAEVDALLAAALKEAGPRRADVEKLQSEYRGLWEEESKRREAAKQSEPRAWSDLFLQAQTRIGRSDYPGAKTLYLEGLATLPERRPEELAPRLNYCAGLYNLACIYSLEAASLAGEARRQAVDEAFKYLDWALRSDYGRVRCACHPHSYGMGHMAEDKDLVAVRADARYAELVKKYK